MNFQFTKGQRLVLELNNKEIIEGDYESGTDHRIDMVNVKESPKGVKLKGLLSYYSTEVTRVSILNHDENGESASSKLPAETSPQNVIRVPRAEYERLEKMSRDYIYMATMDQRYLEAVTHLNTCETIGVVGLGSEFGRLRTLSLLVLCSWDQIYIFDLFSFRQHTFAPELKQILESEAIRKVVHDSRGIVDCLCHCHGVTLTNIFDTQVADMKLETEANGCTPERSRSLKDCLTHYLNFPKSLLEETKNITLIKWDERPLSNSQKSTSALLVTYLITLKCELENLMLKDFYAVVKSYSRVLKSSDAYMAQINLQNDSIPEGIRDLLNKHK